METSLSEFTVADLCQDVKNGTLSVNRDYQRSEGVWPDVARAFLIETILLGYPMPKLTIHQRLDLASQKTVYEIVDGQQRTDAIRNFVAGRFRVSRHSELDEAAGKYYHELNEDLQEQILSYRIAADKLIRATEDQIREVFRRINSYTVSLTAEEQRHAKYQGAFKWFIVEMGRQFDSNLRTIGMFGKRDFVRMRDLRWIADLCYAAAIDVRTTKGTEIDSLYRRYERDADFEKVEWLEEFIEDGISMLLRYEEFWGTSLVKPSIAYAWILADAHLRNRLPGLQEHFGEVSGYADRDRVSRNLGFLHRALEGDLYKEDEKGVNKFVEACGAGSNVGSRRKVRISWMLSALQGDLMD